MRSVLSLDVSIGNYNYVSKYTYYKTVGLKFAKLYLFISGRRLISPLSIDSII